MMRKCDECHVCCIEPSLVYEELNINKPVREPCPFLDLNVSCNKCKIYERRPKTFCEDFYCSWILGFGEEEDRPDKNGVLTYTQKINNGFWIIVLEVEENGLKKSKNIITNLMKKHNTACIVVGYKSNRFSGDWTILREDQLKRAETMTGNFLYWINEEEKIGLYDLIYEGKL